MTEAESRAFYAARGSRRGPSSLPELLELRARQAPAPPPDAVAHGTPVRIALPTGRTKGVYLDIPGGGFYLNGPREDTLTALGLAVVTVEHRLAPEHPWPAAPEDCEAAARWLIEEADSRFGTRNLLIGGGSAGANLAVATLLRLRDLAGRFAGVALQFGAYDLSGQTPAGSLIAEEYFLEAYVGHVADRTRPDISPIFGDLRGLPPSLLLVGALDILLADNEAMAARLAAAGVPVELRIYPESPHNFTGHPTSIGRRALRERNAWLLERLP